MYMLTLLMCVRVCVCVLSQPQAAYNAVADAFGSAFGDAPAQTTFAQVYTRRYKCMEIKDRARTKYLVFTAFDRVHAYMHTDVNA